jgi:sarcosine oxidase
MIADVLVLGVGGMGAAALAHLAGRGLRVVGVEQDDVPSQRGSSVGETRVIRKAYFEDPRYVPLIARAYELWRALEEESAAAAPLLVQTGILNLGPADHPAIRGVLESATQHHLPHARLSADDVRARFPAFVPAPGDIGVYEDDGGYLRAEACTLAHARLALARGAELRTRTTVQALAVDASGVRATLHDGEVIEAKSLVVSAGAWLASAPARHEIARDLTPLTVERQVQLWFRPLREDLARAPAMPAFIHFVGDRAYYGVPLADPLPLATAPEPGLKVARHHGGDTTTADTLDRAVREGDIEDVRGYLRAHMPNGDGPTLLARVCMYTNTPDQHFLVGPHPRWPHVVVLGGFSGHGYKMASVMGEIAADLVEHGRSDFDLALFDPGRR